MLPPGCARLRPVCDRFPAGRFAPPPLFLQSRPPQPEMAKPRIDLIDRLQYLALRLVAMCAHCWPVEMPLDIAKLIGTILFRLDRKHRERAMSNLRRSFPHLSERQLTRLAHESMQHMCMLGVEVMFTTRLIRIDTFSRHVRLVNFRPVLELLLKREQGLILLTGHYGNWEILGYVLATLGFPTVSVARPLDNPYVSEWVFGVRERTGQKIIAKKGAVTEISEALDAHGAVGFIADQNAGSKGLFVDFFGRKASTYKSIALVAMQYEIPVIIGYARRTSRPFHFEIGMQDIICLEDWKTQDDPVRYITQRYTKAIEDTVRADPAQYLWVHRRWKTRPKGEEPEKYD
jgi:KDO2-lipid IV(A) lauroyltransferase